jgi:hypothetical protein
VQRSKETFDDPTLPEWEHAREAIVVDGVLKMNPGSFALRFGDFSDITLTVKVKYSGPGRAVVAYYFRDEGRYTVILEEGIIVLEKNETLETYTLPTDIFGAPALDVAEL